MYNHSLHSRINALLGKKTDAFHTRLAANAAAIYALYRGLYADHPACEAGFEQLMQVVVAAHRQRSEALRQRDADKSEKGQWFLSQDLAGMSLYVDRFCGKLKDMPDQLPYFQQLGVNFLHLMPLFQSPPTESDGGYAVSDFRTVDERFGSLGDLEKLIEALRAADMYVMLDIVLNHTSHHHEWAKKAKSGDKTYQDYYYFYDDRHLPAQFEATMPEIFPESAPGSFSYVEECDKWVMTVFHNYQWDLNYTNPAVLCVMLDTIFFYANLGVDVLRIDAPAFIWKQLGTTCQNLPEAHALLRLIKLCVEVSAPGMALLGEAIVAPKDIMKYFGEGDFTAKECDFAYNATLMALQWDALASGETGVMMVSQDDLLKKPYGTSWITYTRCHDDIGLGYEDAAIQKAGFGPYEHRKFIKDFYSAELGYSFSKGALFSVNPKTQDARISGSLAALCGLEKALAEQDAEAIELAIKRILMMQAHSFFVGGLPMLFYGDEMGLTNDYSYLNDPAKSYDNRWMHRPVITTAQRKEVAKKGSVSNRIFEGTRALLGLRRSRPAFADHKNISWLSTGNKHLSAFLRTGAQERLCCVFNFSAHSIRLPKSALGLKGGEKALCGQIVSPVVEHYLLIEPYAVEVFVV